MHIKTIIPSLLLHPRSFFLSCCILFCLCGCAALQQAPAPEPSPAAPLPSPQVEASATPSAEPSPPPGPTQAPADLPAPAYTITAVYDYAAHHLTAVEQIVYTNRSGVEALSELLLSVDAAVWPGVFNLTSLTTPEGPQVTSAAWERTWLRLPLERPLAPGERMSLELRYELALPARVAEADLRPMVFGWSARQVNLVDWYPYLPPYQPGGAGWQVQPPGYYGEHQTYEASDFTINLQVTNPPPGLSVAAGAPATVDGDWRRYELKSARTFALSLSESYQVSTRQAGPVTITSYFYPEHAAAGERAAQAAAESLELYGRLFGAYRRTALAVVEADFLDGMEYDGLFFLSNGFYNLYAGAPGDYLVALAAHETAHQWWYALVGNDQALQPWLDEALCTYSEKLYYENLYPAALDWWWQVRVLYYQPRGFVDDTIYNPHHEAQPYRAYRDAVYLNGAVFLDRLRALTGDEAFFAFLKDYTAAYAGQVATTRGFFDLLRRHTSADLTPLLQEYFAAVP